MDGNRGARCQEIDGIWCDNCESEGSQPAQTTEEPSGGDMIADRFGKDAVESMVLRVLAEARSTVCILRSGFEGEGYN